MRLLKTNDILLGVDDQNGTFYPIKNKQQNSNLTAIELVNELKEQQIFSSQTTLNLKANGVSMRPLIHDGDLLKLKYIAAENLKMGDIISYVSNGAIITHRVILKIKKNRNVKILEKGDNGLFGVIYAPKVLGKIIKIDSAYSIDTNSVLFNAISKLIALYTIIIFGFYYIAFYLPFFMFEIIMSKFNLKSAINGFMTKGRYLKLKLILTKSIYPLIWIIVKLFKLIYHAGK